MKKALTVQDISERLAVSERTVYNLVERGELQAFRVGRMWRVEEKDLESYIEEQKKAEKPAGRHLRRGK